MNIYYKNSTGEIFDLMTDKVFIPEPEELYENSWKYTTSMHGSHGKIDRLFKEIEEKEVGVQVIANDQKDFAKILEEMHDIFEKDVFKKQEGRLYCGEYYLNCFIIARIPQDWDAVLDSISVSLRILAHPFWIREREYFFQGDNETQRDFLDYPIGYPYNFTNDVVSRYIFVPGVRDSNFELEIAGPCSNPAITIGPQTYQVSTVLQIGEYLNIDTTNRKIVKIGVGGERENLFDRRSRDFPDFFARIPAGNPFVSWAGNYRFKLILKTERSEPEWD